MAYKYHSIQIIKLLLLFLMIFIFTNSCSNNEKYSIHIKSVNSEKIDTVLFDSTMIVTGIDIHIQSNLSGYYQIEFKDGDSYTLHKRFKNTIDTSFYSDWYTSKVIINYHPESDIYGDSIDIQILPHAL